MSHFTTFLSRDKWIFIAGARSERRKKGGFRKLEGGRGTAASPEQHFGSFLVFL